MRAREANSKTSAALLRPDTALFLQLKRLFQANKSNRDQVDQMEFRYRLLWEAGVSAQDITIRVASPPCWASQSRVWPRVVFLRHPASSLMQKFGEDR